MSPLTLQEVIDRINHAHSTAKDPRASKKQDQQRHRPEFYIPHITRRLARLMLSTSSAR